jgi:hypothetical protein
MRVIISLATNDIGSEPRYSVSRTDDGYILRLSRKRFRVLGKTDRYGNWRWTVRQIAPSALIMPAVVRAENAYTEAKVTPELLEGVDG